MLYYLPDSENLLVANRASWLGGFDNSPSLKAVLVEEVTTVFETHKNFSGVETSLANDAI